MHLQDNELSSDGVVGWKR